MTQVLPSQLTELLTGVERALPAWLPRQRWFGAKDRSLRRVRLSMTVEFTDRAGWNGPCGLLTVAEMLVGDEAARYHLPLGVRAVTHAKDIPTDSSVIAAVAGLVAYDASADAHLMGELVDLIRTNQVRRGVRFVTEPGSRPSQQLRTGLPCRLLGAEQSNTSVVIGERFILKLFRQLPLGVSPDLELHRALGGAANRHIAPLLGSIEGELHGAPVTLGMVHRFYADATDGWRTATGSIATIMAGQRAVDFSGPARLLGRAVASVHSDLARQLGTSALSAEQLAALSQGFLARLDVVLDTVAELAPHRDRLRAAFAAVADLPPGARVQRVHGDLHLGQVLRTPSRWLLIDFEGEPATPLRERLDRHSPLRDVAGMLRSFDYAAHYQRLGESRTPEPARAAEWVARARTAFCAGYAESSGIDPSRHAALLLAYESDKALYEARYEVGNRPDWASIPLRAIDRMIARSTAHDHTSFEPAGH
jgi:maltokinase